MHSAERLDSRQFDLLLIGAGLANAMIAMAARAARPSARIAIFERGLSLDSRKTWSFHAGDVEPASRRWLEPAVSARWDSYDVRFPKFARTVALAYASIRPADLARALGDAVEGSIFFGADVALADERSVTLASGDAFHAPCVIDGRGGAWPDPAGAAWQTFYGAHLELRAPHGLRRPILMDAQVEQVGGFRFVYALPWDQLNLLIEDTRYSDSAAFDPAEGQARVAAYAGARGWQIKSVLSEERAALAIPLRRAQFGDAPNAPAAVGVRAGLFHYVTGYSLPDAVRVAQRLAGLASLTSEAARAVVADCVAERRGDDGFHLMLNRMTFGAAKPESRYRVFERFYGLPDDLISRFYAGRLRARDKARLLWGAPPVPIVPAMRSAMGFAR